MCYREPRGDIGILCSTWEGVEGIVMRGHGSSRGSLGCCDKKGGHN